VTTPPTELVVVTGASSGIGAATAAALAADGFLVACLSRRGSVPDVSGDHATRLVPIACDVSDESARVDAVAQIHALALPVAGLVNGAGFQVQTPSAQLGLDEFQAILDTNLLGSFRMCQLLHDALRATERTSLIVNIGSFYGKLGVPNFLAYSASKAALAAMTRTLAVEWAREGIAVVDIAPGYVETGLNAEFLEIEGNRELLARKVPVGRLGTSEEIARLVSVLLRERIGFLTGETIFVDGAHGVRL
jgi:NAD(P)-dependent dehydrogenase (short-subunit alcohol dehydrogenase family)